MYLKNKRHRKNNKPFDSFRVKKLKKKHLSMKKVSLNVLNRTRKNSNVYITQD